MSMENSIELAVSSVLKNPILSVLSEINISKILKQSNYIIAFVFIVYIVIEKYAHLYPFLFG